MADSGDLMIDVQQCAPLAMAQAIDATRYTDLLQPHLAFMRRYALRLTGNTHDADDLVQEVMLKLFVHRERLLSVQALQPWLARVMYYHNIDQHRSRPAASSFVSIDQMNAAAHTDDDAGRSWDLPDETPGPESQVQGADLSAQLGCALQQLPAALRRLVQLHDMEELSLPEISAQLGIPVNTLKSNLKRAKCLLRHSLRRLGPERDAVPPSAVQAVLPPPHSSRMTRPESRRLEAAVA